MIPHTTLALLILLPTLAPGQSLSLTVTVTPPSGFTGSQLLNINALHVKGLAGGVTLTVTTA